MTQTNETQTVELQEAHAEIARLRYELHTRKAPEVPELNACETPEEAKQRAHQARLAAAVASYTFSVWCERRAKAEPTSANIKQAKAAKRLANLAANVGYAR